jgi:hypothetical protein
MVGGGGAAVVTVMVKAGSAAVCLPSLTLITIGPDAPTSAADGVPLSWPLVVLKLAHEGFPVMAKVSVLPSVSAALGWKVYAVPATALVPGLPEIVGGVGGVSTPTVIAKAGSEAVCDPSLTLMTMPASLPTSAALGVPVSWPVAESKAAHAGLFVIEKVSALLDPEALG